jgi:RNA polymerase sigma-70 factor (ECF subfamily)
MPLVYDELRFVASRRMSSERPDHTLQTTSLVHEAYLRMIRSDIAWQNRVHFFAVAARTIRHVLVDHAKARKRSKRGGGRIRVVLEDSVRLPEPPDFLELNEALTRLAELDARKADIIELIFFGGLKQEEAAEATGVSLRTIERELKLAKAWLYRELRRKEEA